MLSVSIKQFKYYHKLADDAISRLSGDQVNSQINGENAISHIMHHMAGNMHSRWTDIFGSDGEKEWRNRDAEFENFDGSKEALLAYWQGGWTTLYTTLESLNDEDLDRIIYIRNMGLTVEDAILRQLCHYGYHVGQIVFRAKQIIGESLWQSLSIDKNASTSYNAERFEKPKEIRSFLDEELK